MGDFIYCCKSIFYKKTGSDIKTYLIPFFIEKQPEHIVLAA